MVAGLILILAGILIFIDPSMLNVVLATVLSVLGGMLMLGAYHVLTKT